MAPSGVRVVEEEEELRSLTEEVGVNRVSGHTLPGCICVGDEAGCLDEY